MASTGRGEPMASTGRGEPMASTGRGDGKRRREEAMASTGRGEATLNLPLPLASSSPVGLVGIASGGEERKKKSDRNFFRGIISSVNPLVNGRDDSINGKRAESALPPAAKSGKRNRIETFFGV